MNKMASNDEELFFGADDEPVKDEADNSSVEDAAASDKASAEGGETKSKETEPEVKEEAGNADDEELGEQEIAMVFAKGYKYKDRVIRHAQVQVAN